MFIPAVLPAFIIYIANRKLDLSSCTFIPATPVVNSDTTLKKSSIFRASRQASS